MLRVRVIMEEFMLLSSVEEVEERVRQGRLQWFGHVKREENDDWVSYCRGWKVGEVFPLPLSNLYNINQSINQNIFIISHNQTQYQCK